MKIEAIFRPGTIKNMGGYLTGRSKVHGKVLNGRVVFRNVTDWATAGGSIVITLSNGHIVIYNISDFYRFKIIP